MASGKKYKGEAAKKQASAGLVGRSPEASRQNNAAERMANERAGAGTPYSARAVARSAERMANESTGAGTPYSARAVARSAERMANESTERSRKNIQGQLTLVATPIGNSADISLRALDTLRNAELIFCEDTRQTQKLLMIHGITGKKLVAAHQHNEAAAAQKILAEIDAGKSVVYVSDAGLPLISDPGETIMHAVIDAGAKVTSIPGANAALTALQLSGLPPLPFYFAGFLPPKTKARKDALKNLQSIPATLVFYEAPHRLAETLADMLSVLGNRNAAYARELTKMYEEVQRGTLSQLSKHTEQQETIRGECVICVAPPAQETTQTKDANETDKLLLAALKTLSPRDAAFDVAAKTGLQRRALYQRILELKK